MLRQLRLIFNATLCRIRGVARLRDLSIVKRWTWCRKGAPVRSEDAISLRVMTPEKALTRVWDTDYALVFRKVLSSRKLAEYVD